MNVFSNTQNVVPSRFSTFESGVQGQSPVNSFFPQARWGGGFQQLPFSQHLLQNLIQQIISQLIYAILSQNQNQATPFNDILRGGDGAELIQGFGGNDQLFGNGGNDVLRGGQGHDYLNGGQGNDQLIGGAGNDYLEDNSGNNNLSGGDGFDTVRFSGRFSDYTIEKNITVGIPDNPPLPGAFNGFIITNNATGERNVIDSVEKFQFADGSVTAAQLARHVDASQELVLTGDQDSGIRQRFNISNGSSYRVLDRDASQSLSVGDELEIIVGGDAVSTITLSAEDINAINSNPLPRELNLSNAQHDALSNYFNQGTTVYNRSVIDQDGSGNLSVGDIAKLSIGGFAGNILIDHIITQQDLDAINNNTQTLTLTGDQASAIRDRFNAGNNFRVIDKDNSSSLSTGDELEIIVGNAAHIIVLSDDDIAAINGNPFPQTLNLSQAQQDAIGARFNNIPPPNLFDGITTQYTGIAIDQNGDNQLSEGDIVKLRQTGGFAGLDRTIDHVLTAEDISAIEEDRSNPLLDISNGLSDNQKQRLNNALFGGLAFTSAPRVDSVFDHNSDGKLSVGDTAITRTFDETTGAESLGFVQITQEHIDKFLNGNNDSALASLLENQQKWENSGLKQSGYSFRLDRSAFAPQESIRPTNNYVTPDGTAFDLFADNGQHVPDDYNHANATVDSLFDEIKAAIDSGADNVQVEYDPTSGYPTSIFIDFNQQIADEELSLRVSNLNALAVTFDVGLPNP